MRAKWRMKEMGRVERLEKVTKRGERSEKVIQKERGLKRMKERLVLVRLKKH